ncbi:hypothetical protein CC2G_002265 [Coprinopsis cinerea AmutBmut pab1-1]|nr:hypothetical protein CC2G_002265 [Coprinopsis cinerea AmutBmut pab1-1]
MSFSCRLLLRWAPYYYRGITGSGPSAEMRSEEHIAVPENDRLTSNFRCTRRPGRNVLGTKTLMARVQHDGNRTPFNAVEHFGGRENTERLPDEPGAAQSDCGCLLLSEASWDLWWTVSAILNNVCFFQ